VLLAALGEIRPLRPQARQWLEDPRNEVFVSAASIWELELKHSAGRLTLNAELAPAAEAAGFAFIPIVVAHAVAAARLPLHHGDPFDRMLVAQAQIEGMSLLSSDEKIGRYQVAVLPA
jgi:PIN domain nuclease of toxin-antitoxin system